MNNALRFCANLKWLFTELPFEKRFEAAANAGFNAVECASPYELPLSRVQELLKKLGLKQILINTPVGEPGTPNVSGRACHPHSVKAFREDMMLALEYANGLECPMIHLQSGVPEVGTEYESAFATLIENISWAAQQASQSNKTLVLEAINHYDVPGYFLEKQSDVVKVLSQVNAANVGMLFDIYHCQRTEGNIVQHMKQLMPHIRHVQVADSPLRSEPGTGEVAWPFVFQQLVETGYRGWIGCEYRPLTTTVDGLGWLIPYGIAAR